MEAIDGLLELGADAVEVDGGCQNEHVGIVYGLVHLPHVVIDDADAAFAAGAAFASDARCDLHIGHPEHGDIVLL